MAAGDRRDNGDIRDFQPFGLRARSGSQYHELSRVSAAASRIAAATFASRPANGHSPTQGATSASALIDAATASRKARCLKKIVA
jgi:hypothetical protein